jgi:anti-sigma regulatory factor (Ser/Thr protein kinase)
MQMSHNMGVDGGEPAEPHFDRIELDAAPTAVRDARDWTAKRLAQTFPPHGQELIDAAVLVVSELVTNAVHAVTQPAGRWPAGLEAARLPNAAVISLIVSDSYQSVRVEVHDRSCVPIPPVLLSDAEDETGRGLIVVDALATGWGWRPSPYGKVVWCELDDGVVRAVGLVASDPLDLDE